MGDLGARNGVAALNWAHERQEKLRRAKQLRHERENGVHEEDHSFQPQFYNTKRSGAVSEYSQKYLRNFHYRGPMPTRNHNPDGTINLTKSRSTAKIATSALAPHEGHSYDHRTFRQDPKIRSNRTKSGYAASKTSRQTAESIVYHQPRVQVGGGPRSPLVNPHHHGEQLHHRRRSPRHSGPNEDALSSEFRRHGLHDEPDKTMPNRVFDLGIEADLAGGGGADPDHYVDEEDDPANNSYEFASSRRVDVELDSLPPSFQRSNNNEEVTPREKPRSGYSSTSKRRQNSAPAHRRVSQGGQGESNGSSVADVGQTRDMRGRIASADPQRGVTQCTRQTGCTCPQCCADASFQSMLRSEYTPSSGPRGSKPEWNSGFDEVEKERKEEPQRGDTSSMRAALKGGKSDFISQMNETGSSGRLCGRQSSGPPRRKRMSPRGAGKQSDPAKVWAPHRGIFKPDEVEVERRKEPTPRTRKADLFKPRGSSPVAAQSSYALASNLGATEARGLPPGVAEHPTAEVKLEQCGSCGRSFNSESIVKHSKLCAKVFKSKRKPFNSAKNRLTSAIQSADDAHKVKHIIHNGGISKEQAKAEARKKRPTRWREKSANLRSIKGGEAQAAPPVEQFVPCPNCGRTFNEQAAARHIPKCKDIKAKPQQLKRGSGRYASSRRR